MTIVYHGAPKRIKIENAPSPRYGLVVLFFTTERRLAQMYSKDAGLIYEAALKADKTIDFEGQVSHSARFRNLIFQMSKEGHNVVAIENVLDRPNENYAFEKSTIYVVFDLSKINNWHQCIS